MKFIHLRVANYRGIATAEVKFGLAGITLVQGPNEAGKTSAAIDQTTAQSRFFDG